MSEAMWSVKQVANRYGVSVHTVLAWIHAGHLKAVDVSRKKGMRPRWRIRTDWLEDFERLRSTGNAGATPPGARHRRFHAGIRKFV